MVLFLYPIKVHVRIASIERGGDGFIKFSLYLPLVFLLLLFFRREREREREEIEQTIYL